MNEKQIIKRWNDVMDCIGCEHLTIGTHYSELGNQMFDLQETGVTIHWMVNEAKYWLSCYYEVGNVRCDDKHDDYKTWRSETGKLSRLIAMLEKYDKNMVVYRFSK